MCQHKLNKSREILFVRLGRDKFVYPARKNVILEIYPQIYRKAGKGDIVYKEEEYYKNGRKILSLTTIFFYVGGSKIGIPLYARRRILRAPS